MLTFVITDERATAEHLGYLPLFWSAKDPRSAKEQANENYVHGGFQPFKGFKLDHRDMSIKYPGDPKFKPFARATLRDETILVYPGSWVMILQKDGSFEIARMD